MEEDNSTKRYKNIADQYGLHYDLYPKQRLLLAHPDDTKDIPGYVLPREVLMGGAAGGSKASPLSTPICTPFGFKPMGSMKVGSIVSSPRGGTAKVIQIHPQGVIDIYKVSFSDGSSTECSADHLWEVRYTNRKLKAVSYYSGFEHEGEERAFGKLATTMQLKEHLENNKNLNRNSYPIIPLTEPVKFTIAYKQGKDYVMPIEPYALGALLGDGCVTSRKTLGFTSIDQEIIDNVEKGLGIKLKYQNDGRHYHILDPDRKLEEYLSRLDLLGKTAIDKHIPQPYLYADIEDRWSLLQGLMDTDGHAPAEKKSAVYYTTISKQLAEDIKFLVQSLGGRCTITENKAGYKNDAGEYVQCNNAFTCYIQLPDPSKAFRLKRKKEECATGFNAGNSPLGRRMVSIEWVRKEEAQCITIDRPDGLYMTNDFIVTHNSFALRAISVIVAIECPGVQIYLIRKTLKELDSNHMDGPNGYDAWLASAVNNKMVKINNSKHIISFKNGPNGDFAGGSKIHLQHVQHEKNKLDFQGVEIHLLLVDEATHFTSDVYTYIRGRVRVASWNPPEKWRGWFPRILMGTNPGGTCVDEGKVLTVTGWKDIREMSIGDEVYAVNPYTLETEVKKVTNTIAEKYTGKLVHLKTDTLDITCTPNHKLSYMQGSTIRLTPFKDLPTMANLLTGFPEFKIEKFNKETDAEYVDFDDYVYCIEVEDNHNFIIEQHNKIWVSGNSHLYFKKGFVDAQDKVHPYKPWQAPVNDGNMIRQYIPATIYDNPRLLEQDPTYIDRLRGLGSDELVDALLNGNWDIVAGGMFDDVWDSNYTTIDPFNVPDNWYINRGFDWGSAAPYAALWFAESNGEEVTLANGEITSFPKGTLFVIEECYGNNPQAQDLDKGIKASNVEIGQKIRETELNSPVLKDIAHKILQGPADNQIFNVMDKNTIARGINSGYWGGDHMANTPIFFRSDKSAGSRIKRWALIRDRFAAVLNLRDGKPMENQGLIIFRNCNNTIRTLPTLLRKDTVPEDIAEGQPDHIADVLGYRCLQKGGGVSKVKVRLGG